MNREQMRKAAKEVAKNEKISVAEVKREMKIAMNATYENPTPEALAIPRKGDIATPQEFASHVETKLKIKKQGKK
jgi:hypothetical protein